MNSEAELLQKLMISKQIMEKHNDMGRGQSRNINMGNDFSSPIVENYEAPAARYNLPQDLLEELSSIPNTKPVGVPTVDAIKNSKLPDEIKKLMMEHPIQQPTMGMPTNSVLSEELISKASRLMGTNAKGDPYKEEPQRKQQKQTTSQSFGLDINQIKQVVRETVEEVLSENGLLVEQESKSSDMFKFRVGQHLFEGKVLKVKKMSK